MLPVLAHIPGDNLPAQNLLADDVHRDADDHDDDGDGADGDDDADADDGDDAADLPVSSAFLPSRFLQDNSLLITL